MDSNRGSEYTKDNRQSNFVNTDAFDDDNESDFGGAGKAKMNRKNSVESEI